GSLPRLDRGKAIALADWAGARGEDTRRDLVIRLMDLFLARLARTGVAGPPGTEATPGEAAILTRLSPDPHAARLWAMAQQELGDTLRRGLSANLDPSALILDTFLALDARAQALGPAESSP
ncbi:MAG: DNA polymerase III subunit delta', partial [Pseudomonadota bacterium]